MDFYTYSNIETDKSRAPIGKMAARKLVIFQHGTALGNAPAHKLFDLVSVSRKDQSRPARSYADYEVTVDVAAAPGGIRLVERP